MERNQAITRFADLIGTPPPVTLVGVGAVGRPLATLLAALGCPSLTLFDPDTVSIENVAPQLFSANVLGWFKVDVVTRDIDCYHFPSDPTYRTHRSRWVPGSPLEGVSFCCADSMIVRRQMFEAWLALPDRKMFVDTRMAALSGRVLVYTPSSTLDDYLRSWYPDDHANAIRCTAATTPHGASLVAALAAEAYRRCTLPVPLQWLHTSICLTSGTASFDTTYPDLAPTPT